MIGLQIMPWVWVAAPWVPAVGLAVLLRRRRRPGPARWVPAAVIVIGAALVSVSAARLFWSSGPEPLPQPAVVVIEPGASTGGIARQLETAGIIRRAGEMRTISRLTFSDRGIRSGRYRFPGGENVLAVLDRLLRGASAEERVTIPEGLRLHRIAGILARRAEVDSAAFMAAATDSLLIAELFADSNGEPPPPTLEGYLLPETYNIYFRMPAIEVVKLMARHFTDLWESRLAGAAFERGWSRHQVVTLASIIEREAATDGERPLVSAVFHNRLRRGMRLESCATVLYALGRYKPRLFERDLQIEHPYNTYRIRGLPPGPIAHPGRFSLLAAVEPADSDYLYFVARGDGTHTFSRTYADHLRAARLGGEGVPVGGRAAREAGASPPPS